MEKEGGKKEIKINPRVFLGKSLNTGSHCVPQWLSKCGQVKKKKYVAKSSSTSLLRTS